MVDEDGDDDMIVVRVRSTDEGEVALVQIAHGRDEADVTGHAASLGLHLGDGGDDVHTRGGRDASTGSARTEKVCRLPMTRTRPMEPVIRSRSACISATAVMRSVERGAGRRRQQQTGRIRSAAYPRPDR